MSHPLSPLPPAPASQPEHDEQRRESLKIIGAISTTCAFPFAGGELYAQHEHSHGAASKTAQLPPPSFFKPAELAILSAIADHIIPATDTPSASQAKVPEYIDFVVKNNPDEQRIFRLGLVWLEKASRKPFLRLSPKQQLAILKPLCDRVDAGQVKSDGERFFQSVKRLTSDGYWTSYEGMGETIGFKTNAILGEYPVCKEH